VEGAGGRGRAQATEIDDMRPEQRTGRSRGRGRYASGQEDFAGSIWNGLEPGGDRDADGLVGVGIRTGRRLEPLSERISESPVRVCSDVLCLHTLDGQ
jgi:hypothetical protein